MNRSRRIGVGLSTLALAVFVVITACTEGDESLQASTCGTDFSSIAKGDLDDTAENLNRVATTCLNLYNASTDLLTREAAGALGAQAATAAASKAMSGLFGIDLSFDPSRPSRNTDGWEALSPLQRVLIHGLADPLYRMEYPLLGEDILPMNIIATLNDSSDPAGRAFPDDPTPAKVRQALIEALGLLDQFAPYLESAQAQAAQTLVYNSRTEANTVWTDTEFAVIRSQASSMAYILHLFDLYEFDTSVAQAAFEETLADARLGNFSYSLRHFNPAPYGDLVTVRQSGPKAKKFLGLAISSAEKALAEYENTNRGQGVLIPNNALSADEVSANREMIRKLKAVQTGGPVIMECRSDDQTAFATVTREVDINNWLDNLPSTIVDPNLFIQAFETSGPSGTVLVGFDMLRSDADASDFLRRYLGILGEPLPANVFRSNRRTITKDKTMYDASRIIWDNMLPDIKFTIQ